jgi:hypothetical protein
MKYILLVLLFGIAGQAYAQSEMETDDRFFTPANAPYEDDELDRIHKKNELAKSTEQLKKTENKVSSEFSTTTPDIMASYEARMMDDRIVAENKRRQKAILSKLASSSSAIHQCISKNVREFQGSHATVIWMIAPNGKVLDTAIKNTDIENPEIQNCIHSVASSLTFDEAKTDLFKKSHVEYTYKFKKKIIKSAHFKRPAKRYVHTRNSQQLRRTASLR